MIHQEQINNFLSIARQVNPHFFPANIDSAVIRQSDIVLQADNWSKSFPISLVMFPTTDKVLAYLNTESE